MPTPAAVRPAEPADLPLLAGIEDDGDEQFGAYFGRPTGWAAAPSGDERARLPGFLLVAESTGEAAGEVVGFVHVLEVEGQAHLEQLSVLRAHQRAGVGRTLLAAARAEAARRGHARITLATYADVPWNAPFYARLGFVETSPTTGFLRGIVATERRLGLDRLGRRVLMVAPTADEATTSDRT